MLQESTIFLDKFKGTFYKNCDLYHVRQRREWNREKKTKRKHKFKC